MKPETCTCGKPPADRISDFLSGKTMIEFKQWVALKATPLLIVPLATLVVLLSTAQATVIKDLRIGNNKGFVRLVLEFDRPLAPLPSSSVDRDSLKVTLAGIDNLPAAPAAIDGIAHLAVFRQSGKTCIETVFAFVPADIKTFSLTGPHRFIVDAYRPLPIKTWPSPVKETIDSGVIKQDQTEPDRTSKKIVSASNPENVAWAGPEPYTQPATDRAGSDAESKNRLQQHLVAALIVVTSIIAMLLFFLIRTGGVRSGSRQHTWIDRLPSTKDPDIEAIDSAIRNQLETYDRL